jgi:hypothetical protein
MGQFKTRQLTAFNKKFTYLAKGDVAVQTRPDLRRKAHLKLIQTMVMLNDAGCM